MSKRPTIPDLAEEAGVSVATVNRILAGKKGVRQSTVALVLAAAERIGYHGVRAISSRGYEMLPSYKLGFVLQQSSRELYRHIGEEIAKAAKRFQRARLDAVIDFVDVLEPANIARHLHTLGKDCDAIALIAADHPLIGHAIFDLKAQGIPVTAFLTDQSTPARAAFVGGDDWKIGRTAAWLVKQMVPKPGKIAVFIGHHRYQTQDISDAAFRSFLREQAPHIVLDDSYSTAENAAEAYTLTVELLCNEPDLAGIFVIGGGISGALDALREAPTDVRQNILLMCREIGPHARKGLSEGLLKIALHHPMGTLSDMLIQTMLDTVKHKVLSAPIQRTVPFEIMTPENC